MVGGDCDEDYDWDEQPPRGEVVPLERPPGEKQRRYNQQEA